jgi:hypothetical protein
LCSTARSDARIDQGRSRTFTCIATVPSRQAGTTRWQQHATPDVLTSAAGGEAPTDAASCTSASAAALFRAGRAAWVSPASNSRTANSLAGRAGPSRAAASCPRVPSASSPSASSTGRASAGSATAGSDRACTDASVAGAYALGTATGHRAKRADDRATGRCAARQSEKRRGRPPSVHSRFCPACQRQLRATSGTRAATSAETARSYIPGAADTGKCAGSRSLPSVDIA